VENAVEKGGGNSTGAITTVDRRARRGKALEDNCEIAVKILWMIDS
jgi:hypothetical protein